jgi:EAL domain-containing protein (putative c-di-GMP-specific phosphodiesterase class I)
MKNYRKLFFIVPAALCLAAATGFASFKYVQSYIVAQNEALVASVAQELMPALLTNDTAQINAILKSLKTHPGIEVAELVSAQGVPVASYVKPGIAFDPFQPQFELASAESDPYSLHVMTPMSFDSQIVANLHMAVNLWPAYVRIMNWLGFSLLIPTLLYLGFRQLRLRLRIERVGSHSSGSGGNGGMGEFNVNKLFKQALADADMHLEYQPIARMSDAGLFGMEVVVCWNHPSGQTLHISPADFIALAEKNGHFLPFADWVLDTALQQAAAWKTHHNSLVLQLNVSASQFKDPAFASKVRAACLEAQFDMNLIEFEIHESSLSTKAEQAVADIQSFVDQGLSLTLDGFGVSEAAPYILANAPVHKVKLDKKLIKNVVYDTELKAFVTELTSVAIANHVQLMAEGVDTREQRQVLQKMGVILAQGNYLKPPLSSAQFANYLKDQPKQADGGLWSNDLSFAKGSGFVGA